MVTKAQWLILSLKFPVAYIDMRVFVHATEDDYKVIAAARNIMPREHWEAISFKKTNMTGHHGNSIVLLEARIDDKNAIDGTIRNLAHGLNSLDKERLSSEFEQFLERGNLYLRLDKQSACQNRLRLESADPIHLKLHFKRPGVEEVKDVCRKYGLIG